MAEGGAQARTNISQRLAEAVWVFWLVLVAHGAYRQQPDKVTLDQICADYSGHSAYVS